MTSEQQKEQAREFMRALDSGNATALAELTAPNFTFELISSADGIMQALDRAGMLEALPKFIREMVPKGFNYGFGHAIAEGPHVSMQGTCDTIIANGRRYTNRYHWYFRFVGDKVDLFREYMDSYAAAEAFKP